MSSDQGIPSSTNINNNNSANAGASNAAFQAVRPSIDQFGRPFDNSMTMFSMKQQPMASPITGTIYSGPPAKYLNNAPNNYLRPMVTTPKYMSYNGPSAAHQRRQNSAGVENATNDLVK